MSESRLLLVDDDGVVLATFGKGLRDAGYEVIEADCGEDALRLAEETFPHLAILDVRMPGMSGIEVAHALQELSVPVIFLSAYDDRDVVEPAIKEGALGYLVKPIDVSRVIPTIEAALIRAKEIQELSDTRERLTKALDTGNVVNVAVGLIMERERLTRKDAFEVLRRRARSERRKVKEVADELLNAWETVLQLTSAPDIKVSYRQQRQS